MCHALPSVTAGLVCSLGVGSSPLDGHQGFYLKLGPHKPMTIEAWLCKLGTTPAWPYRAFSLDPCLWIPWTHHVALDWNLLSESQFPCL